MARSTTRPCRRRRRPRCSATSTTPRSRSTASPRASTARARASRRDRRPRRHAAGLPDRLHLRRLPAAAVSGRRSRAGASRRCHSPGTRDRRRQGGQRWFHLYPDEKIAHDDELHWTGINQNWNWMCADCHSTNLRRNYDLSTDSYQHDLLGARTSSCEACHGPGSRHVAWASAGAGRPTATKGLDRAAARSRRGSVAVRRRRQHRPRA